MVTIRKIIDSCINEVYHDTIEVTPYEAHLGKKPTRAWKKYLDQDIIGVEKTDNSKIFMKIKKKREKQAKLINESKPITKFEVGEKVLIRTYYQSDAIQKKIDTFYELYSGPYRICLLYTSRCV